MWLLILEFELIDKTLKTAGVVTEDGGDSGVVSLTKHSTFSLSSLHFLFSKHVGGIQSWLLVTPGFLFFHPTVRLSLCLSFSLQVALCPPSGIRYPFYQRDASRDY